MAENTAPPSSMTLEEKLDKIRMPKLQNQQQVSFASREIRLQHQELTARYRPASFLRQLKIPSETIRHSAQQPAISPRFWLCFHKQSTRMA